MSAVTVPPDVASTPAPPLSAGPNATPAASPDVPAAATDKSPARHTSLQTSSGASDRSSDFRVYLDGIYSLQDLMGRAFPPQEWIVEDLLAPGLYLLCGRPKLGKSWLSFLLVISVAGGTEFLGHPVKEGTVLYLALEDTDARLQHRAQKLLADSEAPANAYLRTQWPRVDQGGMQALALFLAEHPDTCLIVIDTLAKIKPPPRSRNASSYDEEYALIGDIKRVADEFGVAIVLVHHTRKMEASDPLDEISGTTGITGAADGAWILKRDRATRRGKLRITGRDVEEQDVPITLDDETMCWVVVDADEPEFLSESDFTVQVLERSTLPMTAKGVAEALEINESTAKMRLGRLVKDGRAVRSARGLYTVPDRPAPPDPPAVAGTHTPSHSPVTSVTSVTSECAPPVDAAGLASEAALPTASRSPAKGNRAPKDSAVGQDVQPPHSASASSTQQPSVVSEGEENVRAASASGRPAMLDPFPHSVIQQPLL